MQNTEATLALICGGLIWALKYLLKDFKRAIERHTVAAEKQAKSAKAVADAVNQNAAIDQELLTFMKRLNGKLEGAAVSKIVEQVKEATKE